MKYPAALFIKFLIVTGVLWIVLGLFFGVSFSNILTLSVILTLIAFAGDVYILPRIGNMIGAIGDFALTLLLIWMIGAYFMEGNVNWAMAALSSAIVVSIAELFFHRIMQNNVYRKGDRKTNYRLQTEAGKEFYYSPKNNKND